MDEELKTLKEICWRNKIGLKGYTELKAEAIKWYKKINKRISRAHWREFFNITEEDLK
ncbi:hypothetical protein LCGC14_2808010 [marine sediment metagenome]|uniref:Uncharacterized protein n=1 Tax=marine sediment metagenome TaxID=412755 RepID=A0A0F8Z7K3_9ZZZZ